MYIAPPTVVITPWDAVTSYNGGEVVTHNGQLYYSIFGPSSNEEPGVVAGWEDFWDTAAVGLRSPEAMGIPRYNPLSPDYAKAPYIAVANAATALEVYNQLTEPRCNKIYIQNLSTTALKFTWNMVAGDNAFHGVLAACAAQDDGLGGIITLDVKERGIKSVSLYCEAAAIRASVEKFLSEPPVVGQR